MATARPDHATATIDQPAAQDQLAQIDAGLGRFNQSLAALGIFVMLGVALIMAVEVFVLRPIFSAPIPGLNEVFETLFAVAIAATLAAGISERATLEVDLLAAVLPDRVVRICRAYGAALYVACLGWLAVGMWGRASQAITRGDETIINQLPLGPFYLGVAVLFALTVPTQAIVALRHAGLVTPRRPILGLCLISTAAITTALGFWVLLPTLSMWFMSNMMLGCAVLLVLAFVLILLFFPVSAVLALIAILGTLLLFGGTSALGVNGTDTLDMFGSMDLSVVPFFLLMGIFAVHSGMAEDIYDLAQALFQPFRGGLALGTVVGCAGFGALTGSSVATVATIGAVSLPEMKRRGYSTTLSTGTIAAGGVLGQLVPPSTAAVIYALLAEQSIGDIYMALVIPAALTVLLYLAGIVILLKLRPADAPEGSPWNAVQIRTAMWRALPGFGIFIAVIGGLFAGIFTATEAAGVGAALSFLMLVLRRKLTTGKMVALARDAASSVAMIYLLMIGGILTTFFLSATGVTQTIALSVAALPLPGWAIITLMSLAFLALGCVMDSMAIMMVTASLTASIATAVGYDAIWWGVVLVVIVELGVITPPFGLNLFALKGIAQQLRLTDLYRGVLPFIACDLLKLALLIAVPALATWLPNLLAG